MKKGFILCLFLVFFFVLILGTVHAQDNNVPAKDSQWTIISLFKKGGITMYPILFCSILSLAICLERLYHLRSKKIIDPEFLDNIQKYWYRHETKMAISTCQKYDISISRILRAGLFRFGQGFREIERAIEGAGQHETSLLTSNLRILGAIANIVPMLGLLGTVLGMIKAFNVISQSGTGNPGLVASGIAEALITTAAGLMIGIPTLAAYHFFRGKVDNFVFHMEEISLKLLEDLVYKPESQE
jgi:biopolymer transport protein ExbB